MKNFLFVFISACFLATPAMAEDFVEIIRHDFAIVSIDTDSVEERDDYVVASIKWVYKGEALEQIREVFPMAVTSKTLVAFDRHKRLFQRLAVSFFDNHGSVVGSMQDHFSLKNYKDVILGTNIDFIYDAVIDMCGQETSQVP